MQNIFYPLEQIYKFLYLSAYGITGNYGVALILLSFFIYIILFPLNQKAQQVQNLEREVQSIIAPQIEEIKKQYHGKEQYEKIQRLYHRYAYHPIYAIRSAAGIILQIPFFVAARSMLYALPEIKGVQWGMVQDLGKPDQLLGGMNLLPFVMTFVTILYAFVMPRLTKKEITQTIIIGIIFLIILYPAPSALLVFWTCNLLWSLLHCVIFDRFQWANDLIEVLKDYITENELAFHVIFALALTAGLLVPLEVYIKNARQLWFGIKDAVSYFLYDTVLYFAVLFIISIIFRRKNVKFFYIAILLGLLFGVFLQSYVISIDYGMFDGHEIRWEKYSWQGVVNTFIWLLCLGGAFVLLRRLKFDKARLIKLVKPLVFCIVSIQCVVLALNIIKKPLPPNVFQRRDSINVLTTKDMFTISSRDNIIVFLLDAFDAKILEEIIKKDPYIINELKGFTFYPDTTSVYGYTEYSLPQILTGKIYYNDKSYTEYFEDAWDDNVYYKNLEQKNYNIGIYSDGTFVSKKVPITNLISGRITLNNRSMHLFNNLVLFRIVPHYVKKAFYNYDPNARISLLENQSLQPYKEDDRKFFLDLKKGLKIQDNNNSFRFYHLFGAHSPFTLDRNVEPVLPDAKGNQYEQSLGALKIVLEFIAQMKKKSLFDNSTFAIMADHGDHNKIGSRPLLCIKRPNDKFDMKVSKEAISFSEFMPMLLHSFEGKEVSSSFSLDERVFFFVDEEKGFVEYKIIGNAKDITSWQKNRIYSKYREGQSVSYNLGEIIDFTVFGNSTNFKKSGWSEREETHGTWSIGSDTELSFRINDYQKKDLTVKFTAFSFLADLPYRTAKIYVNKQYITDLIFDNKRPYYSFKIPASVMEGNLLDIHFSIDNSDRAINYENNEKRHLGIFMQKLIIEAAD